MHPPGEERYLDTIQPEYRNLSFASEVIQLLWRHPEQEILELDVVENIDKVKRTLRFLRRLNIVEKGNLTHSGGWLATVYSDPEQQALVDTDVVLGRKNHLGVHERETYLGLLTGHHWLPMLATVHHIAYDRVPKRRSERPVDLFASRIDHLEPYEDLSENAWRTRANVHYGWFEQLDLAAVRGDRLVLSDAGAEFNETVLDEYPNKWQQFE